jgi:hypothetical protein
MHIWSDIIIYVIDIFGHWQAWPAGVGIGAGALLILVVIERLSNYKMSRLIYASVFIGAFFLGATFLAWRDQFNRANRLFRENSALNNRQPSQPIIVSDTAEEQRLRDEVQSLREQLDERQKLLDRETLSRFLAEGNSIKAECDSLEDRPYLNAKASKWASDTSNALRSIDDSYAARFEGTAGVSYSRSIGGKALPKMNEDVWNFVNIRTDALARILESMPN